EGSVLFASLIQPVLLFPAGFAIDLAAIERIADSFAPPAILFLFAIIRHHGGLCDKDAPLPEVIKASSACANSDGIRFSVMARSNGRSLLWTVVTAMRPLWSATS